MGNFHEGYHPSEEDMNTHITQREAEDFCVFMRDGYSDVPFTYDENGDLVQPDKPIPEDLDEFRKGLGRSS